MNLTVCSGIFKSRFNEFFAGCTANYKGIGMGSVYETSSAWMPTEATWVRQAFTKQSFVRSRTPLVYDEGPGPLAGTCAFAGVFMDKALTKCHSGHSLCHADGEARVLRHLCSCGSQAQING